MAPARVPFRRFKILNWTRRSGFDYLRLFLLVSLHKSLPTSLNMAKRRRKTRTHLKGPNNSSATTTSAPKSFVIRSGTVSRIVHLLVQDVRKVMEPNTATRLRERKSNKLRDFVAMSGPLGVSHMIILNQTDHGVNMRVARCPRGPTCTFRVNKFALMADVLRSQKRPRAPGGEFVTPPLVSCCEVACTSS